MAEQAKYIVYLARALQAEEQAAKTKDAAEKTMWLRAAKEYRHAAQESRQDALLATKAPPDA